MLAGLMAWVFRRSARTRAKRGSAVQRLKWLVVIWALALMVGVVEAGPAAAAKGGNNDTANLCQQANIMRERPAVDWWERGAPRRR